MRSHAALTFKLFVWKKMFDEAALTDEDFWLIPIQCAIMQHSLLTFCPAVNV
jgi:hypothetical protein